MASYYSLLVFALLTMLYYVAPIKPVLTVNDVVAPEGMQAFQTRTNKMLGIYLLLVICSQILLNIQDIIANCGGSIVQNIGAGFLVTLPPWFILFGAVVGLLKAFPTFNSAFSNVVGYFFVAQGANNLLTELLLNPKIEQTLEGLPEEKAKLQAAADAIMKICGNTAILINQIVPSNFEAYWTTLIPLMKPTANKEEAKQMLLSLVVTRDNIGEGMWYLYTAILVISITSYGIASRSCNQDVSTMQAATAMYQQNSQESADKDAKWQSTMYKI